MHYEITINPSPSGFGEFQAKPANGDGRESAHDLVAEIASNVDDYCELGTDELIDGAEDIRGRICNEPPMVFAARTGDTIHYFGIQELE
jgi:hypothetical protein